MRKKPIVAILYDFDKTLCREDMQNFKFIPSLGMTPQEFWGKTGEFSRKENVERILSYMYMMIKEAKDKGIQLTKDYLNNLGKDIEYFDGVTTWFKRINEYGKSKGVKIEHYLVSSGTKEIIDGSVIAKEFKAIYGCEFLYDEKTKEPIWPKMAINYTQKTQYIFRVSKGVLNAFEDDKVNEKSQERRIPYRNIIYLGDGMTDIPCMVLVKENGGRSIAVYPRGKKDLVQKLFNDGRVNYICQADYRNGSQIDRVIKLAIDSIAIANDMSRREAKLSPKVK